MNTVVPDSVASAVLVIVVVLLAAAAPIFIKREFSVWVLVAPVVAYAMINALAAGMTSRVDSVDATSIEVAKTMGLESGKTYPFAISLTDKMVAEGPTFSIENFKAAYTQEGHLLINFGAGNSMPVAALEFTNYELRQQSGNEPVSVTVMLANHESWRDEYGNGGGYGEHKVVSSAPCEWRFENLVFVCGRTITRELVINDTVKAGGLNFIVSRTNAMSMAQNTRVVLVLPLEEFTTLKTNTNGGNNK